MFKDLEVGTIRLVWKTVRIKRKILRTETERMHLQVNIQVLYSQRRRSSCFFLFFYKTSICPRQDAALCTRIIISYNLNIILIF